MTLTQSPLNRHSCRLLVDGDCFFSPWNALAGATTADSIQPFRIHAITMQARPPSTNGPSAIPYHPPVAPTIPPHIGQLIPRIRIAIQDIDVFQNMVAQGVIDSSMPSWCAHPVATLISD